MDEKYYITINDNERKGPYTLQELKGNITPETKLWNKSLPTWMLAKDIPELQPLLSTHSEEEIRQVQKDTFSPPSSWLLASSLIFFFFSSILGAIALFHATKVDDNYMLGNYKTAIHHSRRAKLFVIIGLIFGATIGLAIRLVLINTIFS